MSSVSVLEATIVMVRRYDSSAFAVVSDFLREIEIHVVPFTPEMARIASEAYLAFGKGRHPARLNFGDCCAYALARVSGQPLLYKGDDFARTDVTSVLSRA